MRWKETNRRLTVYPSFVLLACVMIWLDDGGTALFFLMSAALHECGHLLALRLLGVPVYAMELRASGAVLHSGTAGFGREAVCIAAGPLVNLLLLTVCFHRLPSAALVNLLLFVYNMLPIYPLDGGRLLRILLCLLFGTAAGERVSDGISVFLTLAAVACGILLTCVLHAGLCPCLLAALFLCKLSKSPCKMPVIRLK